MCVCIYSSYTIIQVNIDCISVLFISFLLTMFGYNVSRINAIDFLNKTIALGMQNS